MISSIKFKRLEEVANKLKQNEYESIIFNNKEDAVKYIANKCKNKTVGIGDSHTIEELGLIAALQKQKTIFYACQLDKTRDNKLKSLNTDIFILSANGISEETGELVNIDSSCNRIAGSLYGPTEVLFVIGKNKIAKNLNEALNRARNIASPKNSAAHEYATPCVITGKCENCSTYDRICRATVIYHKKPKTQKAMVILINDNLGF